MMPLMVDPQLAGHFNQAELIGLACIARDCVQEDASRRPTMRDIVAAMEDLGLEPDLFSSLPAYDDYDDAEVAAARGLLSPSAARSFSVPVPPVEDYDLNSQDRSKSFSRGRSVGGNSYGGAGDALSTSWQSMEQFASAIRMAMSPRTRPSPSQRQRQFDVEITTLLETAEEDTPSMHRLAR